MNAAAMSKTTTATISRRMLRRPLEPGAGGDSAAAPGASAALAASLVGADRRARTSGLAAGSVDTHPPDRERDRSSRSGRVSVLERRQEPVDQPPDGNRPGRHAEQEAGQQEDREGDPELLIQPVSTERPQEGGRKEDERDLGEESEVGPRLTGLDHAPPGKAPGV